MGVLFFFGGELGIRTLGPFRDTAFRVLHLRPLGQLSVERDYYTRPHPHLSTEKGDNVLIILYKERKNIDNGGGLCYTFPKIEVHRAISTPS